MRLSDTEITGRSDFCFRLDLRTDSFIYSDSNSKIVSSPERNIAAVLEESGPDHDGFQFGIPGVGHQGDVYLVTVHVRGETYEVVVKFKPAEDVPFEVESRLHAYVADRSDVPVPRILVFKDEPEADVPPYFITERVSGGNLAEEFGQLSIDERTRVMRQSGRILGDMHSEIGFEAFGRLDLHDDRIIVHDWMGNWRSFFERLTRDRIQWLSGTVFDDVVDRAGAALDATIDVVPEDGVPRLVHDDFRPANLLYDPEAAEPITAVLDWQDVLAALPEYNLAQTEFLFIDSSFQDPSIKSTLREEFHAGYREYRDFEFDDEYERRRPLYQLSTLLWRMEGFEESFAVESGLARARAEATYREQFERLLDAVPR